jgi:hypothetical protein
MTLPALRAEHPAFAPRDGAWLRRELDGVWDRYFADTPRVNEVDIEFVGAWKRRLGVIRMSLDEAETHIGINSLLRHEDAPYCITLITVAHELAHYAHGFGSPLPRKYQFPHRGGVIERELIARGLRRELDHYEDWIEHHWWSFYARRGPRPGRR